jgi:hypothetical protein
MYVHTFFRLQTNVYADKTQGLINTRSIAAHSKNIRVTEHGLP